jgi:hypothetical protein
MSEQSILYPVFGLAFWTSLVLLLIPIVRARSVKRREIVVDDFKYGESPAVPRQRTLHLPLRCWIMVWKARAGRGGCLREA